MLLGGLAFFAWIAARRIAYPLASGSATTTWRCSWSGSSRS